MSRGSEERPVLVTGFGPFHNHRVNASWAAVQELQKQGLQHNSKDVSLEIREVSVAYEDVLSTVPKLHSDLKPRLCLHVGVSPYKVVKMEKCGRNRGYAMADIHGRAPASFRCVHDGPDCIKTPFNVESVCEQVSKKQTDVTFEISDDAGRYLCDFIYYRSLHLNQTPVLFVHVPDLDKPYSVQQLGTALKNIITALLDELSNSEV